MVRAIDDKFKAQIESGKGAVVVLAGSGSDETHIKEITDDLDLYKIPWQVRIISAHKQPLRLDNVLKQYDKIEGRLAYIAVAGMTDALSGTVSFGTYRQVVSCPPEYPEINTSCLTNPPGSSNAYVRDPKNAARFVAQGFADINPKIKRILLSKRSAKLISLEEADLIWAERGRNE